MYRYLLYYNMFKIIESDKFDGLLLKLLIDYWFLLIRMI